MAADKPLDAIPEIWTRQVLEDHSREGFWGRFGCETPKRGPLTRRERLRYWRKVEAPRRVRYAVQVLRRGYHEGEDW